MQARKLTKRNKEKWIANLKRFLKPVAIMYLTLVIVNQDNGFQLTDLIPDQIALGGMILYVANALIDLMRKSDKDYSKKK
jgi:hypothetical protein